MDSYSQQAERELWEAIAANDPGRIQAALLAREVPIMQTCRDCGHWFPFDPDADRCPRCVRRGLGL
jgi:hypothetical protein